MNHQVDNKGDRGGDSLKSPSDKGNGKRSNSELTNRESKIDLDSVGDNVPTVTEELEIKTEVDNSSEAATPETIVSELLVEAVTEVVPSEIDWVSYPYNSSGAAGNSFAGRYTLENRANKVKARILACATSNELIDEIAQIE